MTLDIIRFGLATAQRIPSIRKVLWLPAKLFHERTARTLRSFLGPSKVWIRGSHCRGTALPFVSDLDLAFCLRADTLQDLYKLCRGLEKARSGNFFLRDHWQFVLWENQLDLADRYWFCLPDYPYWSERRLEATSAKNLAFRYLDEAMLAAKTLKPQKGYWVYPDPKAKLSYNVRSAEYWWGKRDMRISAAAWMDVDRKLSRKEFKPAPSLWSRLFVIAEQMVVDEVTGESAECEPHSDPTFVSNLVQAARQAGLNRPEVTVCASGSNLFFVFSKLDDPEDAYLRARSVALKFGCTGEIHTESSFSLRSTWIKTHLVYGSPHQRRPPPEFVHLSAVREALHLPSALVASLESRRCISDLRYCLWRAAALEYFFRAGEVFSSPSTLLARNVVDVEVAKTLRRTASECSVRSVAELAFVTIHRMLEQLRRQ